MYFLSIITYDVREKKTIKIYTQLWIPSIRVNSIYKHYCILFLHAISAKVQITVSIVRIIGIIRVEYNNGRIHDDKSVSQ